MAQTMAQTWRRLGAHWARTAPTVLRILILILVFPCSRMPESPCRATSTISYGLQGCIVFCTQKNNVLGDGKRPRMPLLVAKTTRECNLGEIRQKRTFLDHRRPQMQDLPQPSKQRSQARVSCSTSHGFLQVRKSKHQRYRAMWNNLSAPAEKETEAELEKEAWASPDHPSPKDLPFPPST